VLFINASNNQPYANKGVMHMGEQEIIEMLALVGEELQEMGLKRPIRILLIGGAYMVTQIYNRSTTRDVDIITQKITQDSEEYRLLKEAAKFIAQDLKASPAWLSDNMAQFFQSLGKVPNGRLWFSRGKLEVHLPDPGYVLVLKMISSRDKDIEDMEALFHTLRIKKRKQAEVLIKKYLSQTAQKEYNQEIQISLDSFFQ
jgi:hypothetical protein